jgi:signal transduction histidine kinase
MTISANSLVDCRHWRFTAMNSRQDEVRRLGLLSASVIHDLRNPLAAIQLSAEMLSDVELPAAQRRKLAPTSPEYSHYP